MQKLKNFKYLKWLLFKVLNISYVEPLPNLHDNQQNIYLIKKDEHYQISEEDIQLNLAPAKIKNFKRIIDGSYGVVQAVSANNQVQFKNWPINYWASFF